MQSDKPQPSGDDWYYEIGGRTHGPLTWAALDELLSHSGETATEVRVRQGPNGEWGPFRSGSSFASTQRIGPAADSGSAIPQGERTSLSRPQTFPPRGAGGGFLGLIRGHPEIVATVGIWLLFNVLFVLFWPQPYARERRYLATLRKFEAEVQQLRAKPASEEEWRDFRERSQAELSPIVRELEKSSSSSELARQQLLWSARDLLPRTLGPRTKERDAKERQLKQYLDSVDRSLAGL